MSARVSGVRERRTGGAIAIVVPALILVLFFPVTSVQWIGFVIILVVALSYVYSVVIGSGLVIRRPGGDLVAYRYVVTSVRLQISNRTIFPIPHLVISDNPGTLYSGNENVRLLSLRPGERTRHSYRIKGMNRGSYRIGPVTVQYSDPLGLFPVTSIVPVEIRLIVYPSILPVAVPMLSGLPAGTITAANPVYEDPSRYRSVREYIAGDEQRRINWKVSARTGRLHSTEWLPTITFPVLCLLNLTAADYARRHRYQHVERTIDATASLVHALAEQGQSVGLVSTGVLESEGRFVMPWIGVAGGLQHASEILQVLAQIQVCSPSDPDPVRDAAAPDIDDARDGGPDIVSHLLEKGPVSFGTRVFYLGPPLTPERVVQLSTGLQDRSMLRLHYTDEQVSDWRSLAVESVELMRITENGDELFTRQG